MVKKMTTMSQLLNIDLSPTASEMYFTAMSTRMKPPIPRTDPTCGTIIRIPGMEPIPPSAWLETTNP